MDSDIVENFDLVFDAIYSEFKTFLGKNYDINKYLRPIEVHSFFPAIDIVPDTTNIEASYIGGSRNVVHTFQIFLMESLQVPTEMEPMISRLDEVVNLIEEMRDSEKTVMNYLDDLQITQIKYFYEIAENFVIHVSQITLRCEKIGL